MAPNAKCHNCHSTNVAYDDKNGDLACEDCGAVLDSFAVDDSVEFVENTAGGSSLVSRFVTHGDENGADASLKASRLITFKKGGDRIENVCAQLRIDGDRNVVDFAKSIFQDAVEKRLTWGRSARITAAACVYLAARYKNKELMLTDIAESCQIDVTNVFHVFTDLCLKMNLKVPFHDPCLFVARFAHALELGQNLSEVIKLATTLVRRMRTDFITLGRYPSGIIAAALIFACRSIGIYKTVEDLVKVVRIHESTIKKRMMEFAQTDAAKMTADELRDRETTGNSLPAAEEPPCLQQQRLRAKLPPPPAPSPEEMENLIKDINARLEKARAKAQRFIMARYMTGDLGDEEAETNTEELISEELNDDLFNMEENDEEEVHVVKEPKKPQFCSSLEGTGFDEKPRGENDPPKYPRLWKWAQDGDKRRFEMSANDDGNLDLTGINDDELMSYLCASEKEVQNRKRWFWNPEYDAFLRERARKKALREKMAEGSSRKRKKGPRAKQVDLRGNTAAESFAKMVQHKQLAEKMDSENLASVMKLLGGTEELLPGLEKKAVDGQEDEVKHTPNKRIKKEKLSKMKVEKDEKSKVKGRKGKVMDEEPSTPSEPGINQVPVEPSVYEINQSDVTADTHEEEEDYYDDEYDGTTVTFEEEEFCVEEY